jgi:hypothetical protein
VFLLAAVELMVEQACSMRQESSTQLRYSNIYEKHMSISFFSSDRAREKKKIKKKKQKKKKEASFGS